jgi:5-aminopentanamidase
MAISKVAGVQSAAQLRDTFESFCETLEVLKGHGVTHAVFPECFLTGYFTDRADALRVALSVDRKRFQRFVAATQSLAMCVIVGFVERDGDHLYNSAAIISGGRLHGVYRKNRPNEKCYEAGEEIPVWDIGGLRFGVNICADANYPDVAAAVSEKKGQAIFMPLNNQLPRVIAESWKMRHTENLIRRAIQTGCYVISADVVGETEERIGFGCTQIVTPEGKVVSEVAQGEVGVGIGIIEAEQD